MLWDAYGSTTMRTKKKDLKKESRPPRKSYVQIQYKRPLKGFRFPLQSRMRGFKVVLRFQSDPRTIRGAASLTNTGRDTYRHRREKCQA